MTKPRVILIRRGSIFDPDTGRCRHGDVLILGDRIASPREHPEVVPDRLIDATGLLVTPGWVDLHTHIFNGQDLSVDPTLLGPPSGVTTMIDAGSVGAHLFGSFAAGTLPHAIPRVRNFLNVSTIGTTSIRLAGELRNLAYVDEQACMDCVRSHPDQIIGIKVRASRDVAGNNATEALHRARHIADEVALPLMVHLGPPPASLIEILPLLRGGDILTHCFTALSDQALMTDGPAARETREARDRGVVFDVGHGMSGFDAKRARAAIASGLLPDTISTDAHAYSIDTVRNLPDVVGKLIALGLTLEEALYRVTLGPARASGLDRLGVGRLTAGSPADVAVMRVDRSSINFVDPQGFNFRGDLALRPVLTVQAGRIVHDIHTPLSHQHPSPPH